MLKLKHFNRLHGKESTVQVKRSIDDGILFHPDPERMLKGIVMEEKTFKSTRGERQNLKRLKGLSRTLSLTGTM